MSVVGCVLCFLYLLLIYSLVRLYTPASLRQVSCWLWHRHWLAVGWLQVWMNRQDCTPVLRQTWLFIHVQRHHGLQMFCCKNRQLCVRISGSHHNSEEVGYVSWDDGKAQFSRWCILLATEFWSSCCSMGPCQPSCPCHLRGRLHRRWHRLLSVADADQWCPLPMLHAYAAVCRTFSCLPLTLFPLSVNTQTYYTGLLL